MPSSHSDWIPPQEFYAKTDKQGRIHLTRLQLALITQKENPDPTHHNFKITIQPAQTTPQ
jgi:hypothetical protein